MSFISVRRWRLWNDFRCAFLCPVSPTRTLYDKRLHPTRSFNASSRVKDIFAVMQRYDTIERDKIQPVCRGRLIVALHPPEGSRPWGWEVGVGSDNHLNAGRD